MASSSMATFACLVVLAMMVGHVWCGDIIFQVDKSSPNFALTVKGSKKEITQVDVREYGSDNFESMTKSGESWTISKPLKGPLNIRLRAEGGGSRVQDDVIPKTWKAGTDYPTKLHFG
ncbi:hypothetical protein QOZ80_9AG0670420 [Eleusine coracana subsp. coracana]|nr:hypothetical protein QOZ80_9BG0693800 [Eleusine coracana subsp. coracana]KAK3119430.1 hypothetical protein QOZ80_9AG0670420 [Eleusine coracana subsp. coracana]